MYTEYCKNKCYNIVDYYTGSAAFTSAALASTVASAIADVETPSCESKWRRKKLRFEAGKGNQPKGSRKIRSVSHISMHIIKLEAAPEAVFKFDGGGWTITTFSSSSSSSSSNSSSSTSSSSSSSSSSSNSKRSRIAIRVIKVYQ